ADDAEIVGDAADLREQLADFLAGFPEFFECVLGTEAEKLRVLKLRDLLAPGERFRHRLAVHFGELWFVVEGFEVRRSAGLIEKNHALRLRGVMQGIDDASRCGGEKLAIEQRVQREDAES